MRINNNLMAYNTHRQLAITGTNTSKAMEKLSSGLRINRAGDDAAGLAISEKMRAQIRGLDQASRNAQDAISLIQTAEGALSESHSILQRMRELAVQSSTDTNTSVDRGEIQKEMNQLVSELDRIGNNTEFNTKKLLNGDLDVEFKGTFTEASYVASVKTDDVTFEKDTKYKITQTINYEEESVEYADDGVFEDIKIDFKDESGTSLGSVTFTAKDVQDGILSKDITLTGSGKKITIGIKNTVATTKGNGAGAESSADELSVSNDSLSFQIGANQGQDLKISFSDMKASALGVESLDITSTDKAKSAITTIENAIESVSTERAKFGAYQNRLEHTINNLGTSSENLTAAESRIRDVDMAKEIMEFTKNNILQQAAQAMLAQANHAPQGVLQLLR